MAAKVVPDQIPAELTEVIKLYIKKGFSPVAAKKKAMKAKGWQHLDITIEQINHYFCPGDNVAIRMGLTAGGVYATVDIDCSEAHVFRYILPETPMWHGRENNQYSHGTYRLPGADSVLTKRYKDVGGDVVVELLAEGTAVIMPPSIHPDGDKYVLHGSLEPAPIEYAELRSAIEMLYLSAMALRYYPTEGSRQDYCLGMSGLMIKSGWPAELVKKVIGDMAKAAKDEEWEKRIECVSNTAEKHSAGESVAGHSLLSNILDDAVLKKMTGGLSSGRKSDKKIAKVVHELNKKHAVVMVGGKAAIMNEFIDPAFEYATFSLSSAADFKLKYLNQKKRVGYKDGEEQLQTIAEIWLDSPDRRQYEGMAFDPTSTPEGHYNLFRGFAVEPKTGECNLYLSHIRDVICKGDEDLYDYVIHWMAHAVQFPGELPEVALVVRGKQGTGKTTWVNYFGELFGQHFITLYSMKQVTGQFNGHLADKIVVCANEAIWGGDKQGEGYLKGLITDPTVPIEFKFKDLINVRNYKRLIVTTNEDWAVPIGADDRRYVVLDISDCYKENKEYFAAIAEQMSNGGTEALMDYLMTLDLNGFEIRNAPYTPSSFDIKLKSSDPIFTFLHEILSLQLLPEFEFEWNCTVRQSEFYGVYRDWCAGNGVTHPHRQRAFTLKIKYIFPGTEVAKVTKANAAGKRPYEYRVPELEVARALYQNAMKSGPEIWPDHGEQD